MKGFCHECNQEFECKDTNKLIEDVYECPHCEYPNHISQLSSIKWRIELR